MAYSAYITRIKDVRKHSNADRLQIGTCFGNNVIVSMETKEGELGVYFPVDGKLSTPYAEKNNLLRVKNEDGTNSGGYLDPDKRHITALKLRGEKSDGLFMPLKSLEFFTKIESLREGNVITTLNGTLICEKYIPNGQKAKQTVSIGNKKKKEKPAVKFPTFEEHIDTAQLAYNQSAFKPGDVCSITLKIHGTSARTARLIKEEPKKIPSFIHCFFNLLNVPTVKKSYDYVSGTRRVTLTDFNGGFYGNDEFRKKYHNFFVGKLQKGEEVFYEISGWVNETTSIMPACNTSLTKDKEFIRMWGDKMRFTYGCEPGENQIHVYRMTMTNEDGDVVEYSPAQIKLRCEQMGVNVVPEFERFIFTTWEDLMNRVNSYLDGADPIGKNHIKEGVVVRIENRTNFAVYKHKGFYFKVLEGIAKAEAVEPDMEEADSEGN